MAYQKISVKIKQVLETIKCVGADMEELQLLYTVGRNIK